jgi:glycosyltransferase involved in cell wall biosynthesis
MRDGSVTRAASRSPPLRAAPSGIEAMRSRRREVLILTADGLAQRGGIGRETGYLVDALDTVADDLGCRVVASWLGNWTERVSPGSLLQFLRALGVVCAAWAHDRVSVLHLNMAGGGSLARKGLILWLGWLLRLPVIVRIVASEFDRDLERRHWLTRWLVGATLRRARFVVPLGGHWRDYAVGRLGLDPARTPAIANGVPDPGPPPARAMSGAVPLLVLGQLGRRKGTPVILEALTDPRLAARAWTITFAGDGKVDAMIARARALGIAERARFLGWVGPDRVRALLGESEVLLLPSHAEGLSVALLEAMASGLAIVTTTAGANGDAIDDGEQGLLVPAGDPGELADALVKLLDEPALRRRMGVAARERYLREFTAERFAARFLALYRACGAGRGAPDR